MASTSNAPPVNALGNSDSDSDSDSDYDAEVRFGVVMYGGVSLAIYINGVANELFEMACATPCSGVQLDRSDESATREIYRRLSWLAGSPELRRQYAMCIAEAHAAPPDRTEVDGWDAVDTSNASRTRLVVDVIAGTSAGGINGVFLAKALANGEQFAPLKDLWVNEGDIGLLLNDKRSYETAVPPLDDRSQKPASLLNSDRMYSKLLFAMRQMEKSPLNVTAWPKVRQGSPLVDEVDLFVTTTDIEGSAVPLRLFDKVVYERRYKQNYRFSYPAGVTPSGNDFDTVNSPFLAFAARCTSSFPFAFEPMTLAAVGRLKAAGDAPGLKRWKPFFPNLPPEEVMQDAHEHRAFGDGGYLDNKPFTYVVEALSQRFSSVPVERKLGFVAPSPEQIDPHQLPDPKHTPDALENSLAALTSIPQYETIREDLQAVLRRNRRIERVERMVRLGEVDIEKTVDPFRGVLRGGNEIPNWSSLKLSEMAEFYGLAFLPYQRLRVYSVTDSMADRLGARWGIDRDADLQYAMRALVRVWRERSFHEEGYGNRETFNGFLDQFDFDYRVRRLGFLLRKIDQITRLLRKRSAGLLDISASSVEKLAVLSDADLQIIARLPKPYRNLPDDLRDDQLKLALDVMHKLKKSLLDVRAELLLTQRRVDAESMFSAAPAAAAKEALRKELREVLSLVLGEAPAANSISLSGTEAAERVRVVLDPNAVKLASASRTLQEGVMFRARALFAAADTVQTTPLQRALINDLESMRVRASRQGPEGPRTHLDSISIRAWELLGMPTLHREEGVADKVVVKVGDSADRRADSIDASGLQVLNSDEGSSLRQFLGDYYLRFDSFDQMSFPLYYDTGTGEPCTVEAIRISPIDATHLINEATDKLHRRKLAGTALANFGAFLDRRWRLNDIMWGRLDGAERLIQALLPMSDDATRTVRDELTSRAHRAILREALVPDGQQDLADLLVKALDEVPASGSTQQRLQATLNELWTGNAVARDRLGGVLASLLSERGLVDYVRNKRLVDDSPDPETTLDSAARAVTITGRVLEGISTAHGRKEPVARWLARLGLLLQGVVAVALPGTFKNRVWTHLTKVIYAFEAFALLVAMLFGSQDMRALALTALGVTIGVHLLTLVAGDAMREKNGWLRFAVLTVLLGLVGLAAIGGLVVAHQAVQQQICWSRPDTVPDIGLSSRLCGWLGSGSKSGAETMPR